MLSRKEYKRELRGVVPSRKVFTHVVGTDLIRDERGAYLVLEDNCRCPSGVSYVLENRALLQRVFPEFFASYAVQPVKDYPGLLLETLRFAAPQQGEEKIDARRRGKTRDQSRTLVARLSTNATSKPRTRCGSVHGAGGDPIRG